MVSQLLLLYLHCSLVFPATWHLFVCTVDDYMRTRWMTILEWTVLLEVMILSIMNGASWSSTALRGALCVASAVVLIWGRRRAAKLGQTLVTSTLRYYGYYIVSAILVCPIMGTLHPYISSDLIRQYGFPALCWLMSPLFGLYEDQLLILTTAILTVTTWDAVTAYALGSAFKASHFVVFFGHPYPFRALCLCLGLWAAGHRVHSLRHKQQVAYQQLPSGAG